MYSLTKEALKEFDNQHEFERMAADILNTVGYSEVAPIAPRGGSDGGMDIRFKNQRGENGLACVTLRQDIMVKFREDFSQRTAGEFDIYILFCTAYLTASQKQKFTEYCSDKLKAQFKPYDIELLRSLLDTQSDIRERYLHIDEIRKLLLKNSILIDDAHMPAWAKPIVQDVIHRFQHWDDTEFVLPDGSIVTIVKPNMRLRQARKAQRLTQQAVAEKIGTDTLTVRRWEDGTVLPENRHIQKLCELFGVTPEELGFASQ